MLSNKKNSIILILLILASIVLCIFNFWIPTQPANEELKMKQEYNLAIEIINDYSGETLYKDYLEINNYLNLAQINHPEFQKKYWWNSKILGTIPFYWSNNEIKGYEHILVSKDIISWSIYEIVMPSNQFQVSNNKFFIPGFSLAINLAKGIERISWNKYFHKNCVKNQEKEYCVLPEEKLNIKTPHEIIQEPSKKFYSLESKMNEYFWTWWFYSYWERGYIYFDSRNHRVFNPMPWSIFTYDDLN